MIMLKDAMQNTTDESSYSTYNLVQDVERMGVCIEWETVVETPVECAAECVNWEICQGFSYSTLIKNGSNCIWFSFDFLLPDFLSRPGQVVE